MVSKFLEPKAQNNTVLFIPHVAQPGASLVSGIMASNVSECFLGPDRGFELSRSSRHLLVI